MALNSFEVIRCAASVAIEQPDMGPMAMGKIVPAMLYSLSVFTWGSVVAFGEPVKSPPLDLHQECIRALG